MFTVHVGPKGEAKRGGAKPFRRASEKKLLRGHYPLFEILHTLLTSEKEGFGGFKYN